MFFWHSIQSSPQLDRGRGQRGPGPRMREVEVYLIRHGESTSNVELKILLESLLGLISFKSYSVKNIRRWLLALWRLTFSYELNSHLSDLGRRQVIYSHMISFRVHSLISCRRWMALNISNLSLKQRMVRSK